MKVAYNESLLDAFLGDRCVMPEERTWWHKWRPIWEVISEFTTTELAIPGATLKLWEMLGILPPAAAHRPECFGPHIPFPVLVRLLLPDRIRPHVPVRPLMLSGSKVVALSIVSATQEPLLCPRSKFAGVEATGQSAIVQVDMLGPLRSRRAIGDAI